MELEDIVAERLATWHSEQEICELLGITGEDLLFRFEDKLREYVAKLNEGDDLEDYIAAD